MHIVYNTRGCKSIAYIRALDLVFLLTKQFTNELYCDLQYIALTGTLIFIGYATINIARWLHGLINDDKHVINFSLVTLCTAF